MISTSLKISVSGDSYEEILQEAKNTFCVFFDISLEEVEKKLNIDIEVSNQTPLEVEDDFNEYIATVTAKVRNV
jgi:SHS2 domain-containing protein